MGAVADPPELCRFVLRFHPTGPCARKFDCGRPVSRLNPLRAGPMNVHEYQAKGLLTKFGVATPRGKVASPPDEAEAIARELGGPASGGQLLQPSNAVSTKDVK